MTDPESSEHAAGEGDEAARATVVRPGILAIRAGANDDAILSEILTAKLDVSTAAAVDAADAFLYIIERARPKPIVGTTVDFKRAMVRTMNATGRVKLVVEGAPIIQDVTSADGRPLVRALVCVIDELSGLRKWAVKEEPRLQVPRDGGKPYPNPHATTVALEKAEGKAYESHPAYNRKMVNARVKQFLRRAGLNPDDYQIGGGGGAWGDLFARAKQRKVSPEAVRDAAREATAGKGLSEIETPAEAEAAVTGVDEAIAHQGAEPPSSPESPAPSSASTESGARLPQTIDEYREATIATLAEIGRSDQRERLWRAVGPARGHAAELVDYRRLYGLVQLLAAQIPKETAIATVFKQWPRP